MIKQQKLVCFILQNILTCVFKAIPIFCVLSSSMYLYNSVIKRIDDKPLNPGYVNTNDTKSFAREDYAPDCKS